ncbi:XRE family transcriptional regulator [Streptomyces qinglanensis]|uniref:XRE family transcriptional regulator n=1 Tax=Streptomyces qinglanensis TaxID=943816 RepID=UPI003D751607
MTGNFRLGVAMKEHGFTQVELAAAVNAELRAADERDSVGERTVRTWLTGKSSWPHRAKRQALEAVFRCSIEHLGFYPPGAPPPPQEDPDMFRRTFLTDVGGAAAAVTAPRASEACARPRRVGSADVSRLRNHMANLIALDAERGGHTALEQTALAGASETLGLTKQSATQRVRNRLYSLAADFTATAAWSLIDAGKLDGAEKHLDKALRLAGMAEDSDMAMQTWNLRAMLARQRKDYPQAVAVAQAAQSTPIARRSPLHASLAHARTAVGLAHVNNRRGALHSLGRAEDALSKNPQAAPQPSWISFYGPAELHALTAVVRDVIGEPADAEAASHQALSALPTSYRRNRAQTTARLALAQLHQGEVERACETGSQVFAIMSGAPLPGRMRRMLGDFQRELMTRASSARIAQEWTDRHRTEWSTP